jgi:hypothetical protein
MYNNPGALKRPSPDISAWGYIRNDARWFLIFPDMATGQRAAVEVKEIVYHAVPYLGMAKVFDFLPGRPSARAATRDGPRGSEPRAPPADRWLAEA